MKKVLLLFTLLTVSLVSFASSTTSLAPRAATEQDIVREVWTAVQPRITYMGTALYTAYKATKTFTSRFVLPNQWAQDIKEL